jgi:hypothetical protein
MSMTQYPYLAVPMPHGTTRSHHVPLIPPTIPGGLLEIVIAHREGT